MSCSLADPGYGLRSAAGRFANCALKLVNTSSSFFDWSEESSPVLRISFYYVYAGIALSLFIMSCHALYQAVAVWRSPDGTLRFQPDPSAE